ncbi:hypothetical protein V6N13_083150 [Hibiscus sabdariffa]
MNLIQVVVGNSVSLDKGLKTRIPEPQRYEGNINAMEPKNFLFDIEQNFRGTRTETDGDKTWEEIRMELLNAFFPENVEYNARKKLRDLTHIGTVREYVREFVALMLDIKDMFKKDWLFSYLDGLKLWARTVVQKQKPQDWPRE